MISITYKYLFFNHVQSKNNNFYHMLSCCNRRISTNEVGNPFGRKSMGWGEH